MGKKYIIELPENTHWIQWIMEGTKDHHPYTDFKQVEDLTPYTEPDLEQVKSVYNAWYEKGLADAWDAAKKIALMDTETSENVTGYFGLFRIMENLTPMQAIEKLKAYEQEKEEQIQVGDEVIAASGKAVVMAVGPVYLEFVYANGAIGSDKVKNAKKTGRTFTEISEVLRKMKETE